jgi:short-subunit dehydrogenase
MFKIEACSALITGASSGLGEEFARQLAPDARQLVLVARREERLQSLKTALQQRWPSLQVLVHVADLSVESERISLAERLRGEGVEPDLLVNNAGVGDYGEFVSGEWSKADQMLQLNMVALTHLSHLLLPAMIARRSGAILNVSSLAGEMPIPDFAVYAASKAYVTSLSEALRIETKSSGVNVVALCPGPVSTEFGQGAQRGALKPSPPGGKLMRVEAAKVVRTGLDAAVRNRPRAFPGFPVFLLATLASALPAAALRAIMSTRPKATSSEPGDAPKP